MRKIILFTLMLGIGFSAFAQQNHKFKIDVQKQKRIEQKEIGIEPIKAPSITKSKVSKEIIAAPSDRETNIVTIIPLGTAANAYGWGFSGAQESLIPVRQDLNTIAIIHRNGGDDDPGGYSGDLCYDVSQDGGATWTTQTEFYIATDNDGGTYYKDAARYPNAGIFQPEGKDGAYLTYFAPILWGTNGLWGAYAYGVANFADTSIHTKNLLTESDYKIYYPWAYFLTRQGLSIAIDADYDIDEGDGTYYDQLILTKGYWDDDAQDFVYTQEELEAPMDLDGMDPVDKKVAFAPDGLTGYISVIGNNGMADEIGGKNLYPIFWKTTDGGETWSDPGFIQIEGPNGLGGIVNHHFTDEEIEEIFEPPTPSRDEISYSTAFDHDIAVDANGNLHIAVIITLDDDDTDFGIFTGRTLMAAVDIFTDDGGTTWYAEEMGRPTTFRGDFGSGGNTLTEDNRIRITTDWDGEKVFISWLNSDNNEDDTDNSTPNIWARGFDYSNYMKTQNVSGEDSPSNVTAFSIGMWQSFYGQASKYCFKNENGYNIPFVFEELDPNDMVAPVRFQYVQDFYFTESDFTVQGVNEPVEINNSINSVSQNFPNPFKNESYVTVNLNKGTNLSLEVYTLTGQMISAKDYGYMINGSHTLTINGTDLTAGVYFYTVTAGENKITRKMIVK